MRKTKKELEQEVKRLRALLQKFMAPPAWQPDEADADQQEPAQAYHERAILRIMAGASLEALELAAAVLHLLRQTEAARRGAVT
jgi:hypothetical protein